MLAFQPLKLNKAIGLQLKLEKAVTMSLSPDERIKKCLDLMSQNAAKEKLEKNINAGLAYAVI